MNKKLLLVKNTNALLLSLFPILSLVTGIYFRSLLGDLSLRTIDPDYVYFSNGLGISLGNFNTGNIFHPGAPTQYFTATIFKFIYLLRSPGIPYLEDIFTHPDIYLSAVSYSFTGVLAFAIFCCGWKVYQYTGSVLAAILIQTTPFLPIIWYDIIGRVTPEVWQAMAVLALSVLLIRIYKKQMNPDSNGHVFLLALVSAFGVSAKVTFLPLLLIPLFVIESWKKRIFFTALSILLFLLISVSILYRLDVFWNWIRNIFIFSGSYGSGEANFIDIEAFKTNLMNLVTLEKFYFQVVMVCFLLLAVTMVFFRKNLNRQASLTVGALLLTILIQLILVSKHFAHRNFIPSLLLMPMLIYFTIEMMKEYSHNRLYKRFTAGFIILFLAFFIHGQLVWLPVKSEAMGKHVSALEETRHFVSTLEDESIRIITSRNYGAPFREYALMYSTVWSNNRLIPEYEKELARLYPNTYQFNTYDNSFKFWGEPFKPDQIIGSGRKVYLYMEQDDEVLYTQTIERLMEASDTLFSVEKEILYKNESTNEVIYRLRLML